MSFGKRRARAGHLQAAAAAAVALAAGSLLLLGGGAVGAVRTQSSGSAGLAANTGGPASVRLTGIAEEVAVDPTTDVAYVTLVNGNSPSGGVAVIDLATATVTATLTAGLYPKEIAVDPATDTVYVADTGSDTVDVIDGATNTVTASIPVDPTAPGILHGIAVDPATNTVYVADNSKTTLGLAVINGDTDTVVARISGPCFYQQGMTEAVAVNQATDTVYTICAGYGTERTLVINGADNSVTGDIPGGDRVTSLAVDPSSHTLFVSDARRPARQPNEYTVSAFNAATDALIGTVATAGQPTSLAVDPATHTLYDYQEFDGIDLINAAGTAVTGQVPLPNDVGEFAADPATDTLVYADASGSTIPYDSSVLLFALRAPRITSRAGATFTPGRRGVFTVRTSGLPVASLAETGALPRGVRFTAAANGTASVTGTPAKSARHKTYVLRLTARNGVGATATQRFTLTIS